MTATLFTMPLSQQEEMTITDHFGPKDRQQLTEMAIHLSYLRERVDKLINAVPEKVTVDDLKVTVGRLDERTRILENFRWWVLGGGLATGATAGWALIKVFHV